MQFSNSLKWASGLQEHHTGHLRAWPLLCCRIFLITTRFSVILMTGRVKITKKNPDFPQSKTLFQLTRFCSVTRVKFAPSLKHMNGVWRWQPVTLCQKGLRLDIWFKNRCRVRVYRSKAKRRSQTSSNFNASSKCYVWSEYEHFTAKIFPGNSMYL